MLRTLSSRTSENGMGASRAAGVLCARLTVRDDRPEYAEGLPLGREDSEMELRRSAERERTVKLEGKTALITGAGMGIGRATALLFVEHGAQVIVADYDVDSGRATVAEIEKRGGQGSFVEADVSDPSAVGEMVRAALDIGGHVDILVNNAGIDLPSATNVVDTEIEDWDRLLDVNLRGVFLCSKCVIPAMQSQGSGVIVNVASVAGLAPMQQEAGYGASKAGVLLLTKQMARDFAREGIRVNSVCPGPMEKPTRDRLAYLEQDPDAYERRQAFSEEIPLGRMCIAEDIAAAVLFLASDDAAMITGVDLVVDGGWLLE